MIPDYLNFKNELEPLLTVPFPPKKRKKKNEKSKQVAIQKNANNYTQSEFFHKFFSLS